MAKSARRLPIGRCRLLVRHAPQCGNDRGRRGSREARNGTDVTDSAEGPLGARACIIILSPGRASSTRRKRRIKWPSALRLRRQLRNNIAAAPALLKAKTNSEAMAEMYRRKMATHALAKNLEAAAAASLSLSLKVKVVARHRALILRGRRRLQRAHSRSA